ncbi:uncharacterized protein cep126 isoform X2 [Syngnathoides biaculeatus]|uniref:uncharacterized protein cep126 isoform X2 n=1 Tax=Syngnathoides biaculeatus TaxID=300417 RepID=UPI002ADE78D3|nr:uncharacterized protein cep126 isoform X2 [Syngnathoides biaculeatus]
MCAGDQPPMQEQRRREEVLQQRRQKIQDVTEHFQRAYVPPSQRATQSERLTAGRDYPNLEDALSQIRGPALPSNISSQRISTPSSRPAVGLSESPLRHTPVVVQAGVGCQEQGPCVRRWQELPKRQERHQEHSGQEDNVSCCSKSDSLSSQDSLENEEPAKSAVLHYSEKPVQDLKSPNDPHPVSSGTGPTFVAVKPHFHRLPVDLNYNLPTQKETCASMNNLNKFSADINVWKHMNTASPKCRRSQESSGSKSSSPAACRVQLMKGILKTLPGETPAESPQTHANSVKPVQFLVCDSIEVARARSKTGDYKNASKKLRWLDEEAGGPNGARPRDAQSQPWADVGVQLSTGVAGPLVPRGDYPARVGVSPVSSGFVTQSPIPVARIRGELQAASKHAAPTKSPYGGDQVRAHHQVARLPPDDVAHKDTQRLMTGDGGVINAHLPSSLSRPTSEISWKGSPASGHLLTPGGSVRGRGVSYEEKVLDRTPTDSEIFQLCQDVRSAFISNAGQQQDTSLVVPEKARTPSSQVLTSGRASNKSGADQNRRPSGSTTKKPPEFFKITCLHATNPVGPSPKGYHTDHPNKGVKTVSQRRLTDAYSYGSLEERVGKAPRTTSQPPQQQYQRRPPAATSISMEEQRIFQSLDRLNCQLHRKGGLH